MKIPIRMKAALYKAPGQPLELAEVPIPTPGEGEVLVKVAAAGVCHSDLHILDGEMIPRRRASYWGTRCLAGSWSSAPVAKTPTASPPGIPSSFLG
jgi:propanol-preferring alcohol dehydrogenase